MKMVINKGYEYVEKFAAGLADGVFENTGKTLHDGRNCVKVFEIDGKKLVVKRFRQPNVLNRVVYSFIRGSKAQRAYRNAEKLLCLGIDTPVPIAWFEIKKRGLLTQSYLITEFTDYEPIREIPNQPKVIQAMLTRAFVKYTVELHKAGVNHHDYNLTNVLYRLNDDYSCDFMLIDVNRMSFGPMSKKDCLGSIQRMCSSPKVTYFITKQYAQERGWNVYNCLAIISFMKSMFERRKHTSGYLKELIRGEARA